MSFVNENVDRLSCLPEGLLLHILSLLPTKMAVQTSILSKTWRYSWVLVTNLEFVDIPSNNGLDYYYEFVDRALELRKASQVTVFGLRLSGACFPKSLISKWISEMSGLNICELRIKVTEPGFELPLSMFTCKTLTKLKLGLSGSELDVYNVPSSINLPCLKILCINALSLPCVNAFKLIHGCPILESLCLRVIWHNDNEEYNFSIPTLKILRLKNPQENSVISNVVLNVPNLEYLFVSGKLSSLFVMQDLSSLVMAVISPPGLLDHMWVKLLKGISRVKSLSLVNAHNVPSILRLPKFPNLTHLMLKSFFCTSRPLLIPKMLAKCSKLQHLHVAEPVNSDLESSWIEPPAVPTCVLKKLKTMKFSNCKGRTCELQFLEYMLSNAKVLKKLTITCETLCQDEELCLCAKLLKFPRASKGCEIQFVGKSCDSTSS